MLDDAPDLAADGVSLAPSQGLDLLGDVVAVEAIIGDRHRAQQTRPGIASKHRSRLRSAVHRASKNAPSMAIGFG